MCVILCIIYLVSAFLFVPREASTSASPLCRKTTCCKSAGRGSLCYPLPVPPEVLEDCATIGSPLPWKHRKHRRLYPGYILAISRLHPGYILSDRRVTLRASFISGSSSGPLARAVMRVFCVALKSVCCFSLDDRHRSVLALFGFHQQNMAYTFGFERGELNKLNSENEG